jgi:hypothetical protein
MSDRAYGSAAGRLKSLSLRLDPLNVHPYYLHVPRGDAEPAPGWYYQPAGAAAPVYIGHNSYEADFKLRILLKQKQAAASVEAAA